jgi:hypothetical protein
MFVYGKGDKITYDQTKRRSQRFALKPRGIAIARKTRSIEMT